MARQWELGADPDGQDRDLDYMVERVRLKIQPAHEGFAEIRMGG